MSRGAMPGAIRYVSEPRCVNPQRSASDTRPPPAARFEVEFVEDVRDVPLDGVQTQIERACDQFVAVARGDARQHFDFARRQPLGSGSDD